MKAEEPEPVKLIVGVITGRPELVDWAAERLEARHGSIDLRSSVLDFDFTRYYEGEMGGGLKRAFLGFRDLIDPGDLPSIKRATNALEAEAPGHGGEPPRPLNLDPGYVTAAKLVLATAKDYSHRLYLGRGVYGEITLEYREGDFRPLAWTYPDYRTEGYLAFFREVRRRCLEQLSASPGRRRPGASRR